MPSLGTGRAHVSGVWVVFGGSQRHGCATCACLSATLWVLVVLGWHGHATTCTGRASLSGQGGQIFFSFSHRIQTKTYKTNKNKQK